MKIADLFIKLGLRKQGFDKGIDDAKQRTNSLGSVMKKVGGVIAGAFAAQKLIAFGKELVNLGGVAQGVSAAFERIGGGKYLDDLKNATAGTVSQLELMKRAITAQNLGIPIENLASLFQFATKRAQDTGESVDYLVNSIVLGIGRKSPLILDNLGISAIQLREKLKGVGLESASVADVAAAVGAIAADSMRESGGIIDTNAIKIQNLSAMWQDLKESIATNKVVIDSVGDSLTKLQQLMFVVTSEQATRWEKAAMMVELSDKRAEKIYNQVLKREQELIKQRKETEAEFANLNVSQLKSLYDAAANAYVNAIKAGNDEAAADFLAQSEKIKNRLAEIGSNEDTAALVTVADRIKQIQEEISAAKMLLLPTTEITVFQKALEDVERLEGELAKLQGALPSVRKNLEAGAFMGTIGTPAMPSTTLDTTGLADMTGFLQKQTDYMNNVLADSLANFNQFKENMAYAVSDFGIEVVEQFGMAMGEFFTSGQFPENFGNDVLRILGKFISNIGKMLITLGVASEAFQTLISTAFMGGAIAAIAAGVALVAIGGAISGAVAAGPKGSSRAGAEGMTMTTTNAMDQQLVARVSGRDLEFVLAKRNAYTERG